MIRRPPRSTRTAHSFPTRRSSDLIEAFFADAPAETLDTVTDHDKAHGRIQERSVAASRETALRQAHGAHRHAPLPRRTAPPRCRHHRPRHLTHRTVGPLPHRYPLLHLLRPTLRRCRRTPPPRHIKR